MRQLADLPVVGVLGVCCRFRAIAGMLDEALAPPSQQQALVHGVVRRRAAGQQAPGEGEGSPPPPLALNSSVVLWGCLLRCWDPEVLIPSIADKFLCLTLQLLSRSGAGLAVSGGGGRALPGMPEPLLCKR